jgi:hypothetical protein
MRTVRTYQVVYYLSHRLYKKACPHRVIRAVLYIHFQLSPFGFKRKINSVRGDGERMSSGLERQAMNVVCVVVVQMEYHDVHIQGRRVLWLVTEHDLKSRGDSSKEGT